MPEICVVHLVRQSNGILPFKSFLDSYRRHSAGVDHDFLIIFKGFDERAAGTEAYCDLLQGFAYRSLFLPDEGFDIGPYFEAAKRLDARYFCFINSFSVILDEDWLAKLYEHGRHKNVGVVGATGSCESAYTNIVRCWPVRRSALFYLKGLVSYRAALTNALKQWSYFPPFPNYHVRTNSFMISRRLMLRLRVKSVHTKLDAGRFESGWHSMTRQIFGMNLKALIVGCDGRGYDKSQWYESATFRSDEQHNLLVADNRTRQYSEADPQTKKLLAEYAWGRN
jgi:hypothetical protein